MSHQVLFCGSLFTGSRLFLVGSSLNGFGTRTSDGDLCLVIKEEPVSNLIYICLYVSSIYIYICLLGALSNNINTFYSVTFKKNVLL